MLAKIADRILSIVSVFLLGQASAWAQSVSVDSVDSIDSDRSASDSADQSGIDSSHSSHLSETSPAQPFERSSHLSDTSFAHPFETGSAHSSDTDSAPLSSSSSFLPFKYVGNNSSSKFHRPSCAFAKCISHNHLVYFQRRFNAIDAGYLPCRYCLPPDWKSVHLVVLGHSGKNESGKPSQTSESGQ